MLVTFHLVAATQVAAKVTLPSSSGSPLHRPSLGTALLFRHGPNSTRFWRCRAGHGTIAAQPRLSQPAATTSEYQLQKHRNTSTTLCFFAQAHQHHHRPSFGFNSSSAERGPTSVLSIDTRSSLTVQHRQPLLSIRICSAPGSRFSSTAGRQTGK